MHREITMPQHAGFTVDNVHEVDKQNMKRIIILQKRSTASFMFFIVCLLLAVFSVLGILLQVLDFVEVVSIIFIVALCGVENDIFFFIGLIRLVMQAFVQQSMGLDARSCFLLFSSGSN